MDLEADMVSVGELAGKMEAKVGENELQRPTGTRRRHGFDCSGDDLDDKGFGPGSRIIWWHKVGPFPLKLLILRNAGILPSNGVTASQRVIKKPSPGYLNLPAKPQDVVL